MKISNRVTVLIGLIAGLGALGIQTALGEPSVRLPMKEPFEQSQRYLWYSKPVHDSKIVDDMESRTGWSIRSLGDVSYTKERAIDGIISLRYTCPTPDREKIRSDVEKDGMYSGGSGKGSSAVRTFDEPQDWTHYNRIALWVYVHPECVGYNTFYIGFNCLGVQSSDVVSSWGDDEYITPIQNFTTPHSVTAIHNLTPGQWNYILWEIGDLQRDRVKHFFIYQRLRGRTAPDISLAAYDIDRIELQRVDAEKYRGWDVPDGKVAFSHVGYRPNDRKTAIASETGATVFQVLNARTGDIVLTKSLETIENDRGQFEVLDFSEIDTPGKYQLRTGSRVTRPFEIGDDIWKSPIEKAINFYYCERCGFEVPGIHTVCHADRFGEYNGIKRPINGGWHDAGDLSQGFFQTGMSVYAMLENIHQLAQRKSAPDLEMRIAEEAAWGLEWILKTRFGDGYRITWTTTRIYTDSIVGTPDDITSKPVKRPFENLLGAAIEAYAARVMEKYDPDLAERCLVAAKEDWDAEIIDAMPQPDWDYLTLAWAAIASLQMFETTGDQQYADAASAAGTLLTDCQEQRFPDGIPLTGFFYHTSKKERIVHHQHAAFEESPLIALANLCAALPGHKDWMKWYAAATLHSEFFLKRGTQYTEPYHMLPASVYKRSEFEGVKDSMVRATLLAQFEDGIPLSDEYSLRCFPIWNNPSFHGQTTVQLSENLALIASARLRGDLSGEEIAAQNLRWIFGRNPFCQSLMYGEGYDYPPLYSPSGGDMVGALPVGIDSLGGDEPYWNNTSYPTFKEVWVVSTSRFLWNAAFIAMPALVRGQVNGSKDEILFVNQDTGQTYKASLDTDGTFAISLSAGAYAIKAENALWNITVVSGGNYSINLDTSRTIRITLQSETNTDGTVLLKATLEGQGSYTVALQTFNADIEQPMNRVTLTKDQPFPLQWRLKVKNHDSPWIAVLIPDNEPNWKVEAIGTIDER